jgi:hypothetical protein
MFSVCVEPNRAHGADSSFDYPELSVVPRASERIESESQKEKSDGWKSQLSLLAPATMSILSGAILAGSGTKSDTDLGNTGAKYAPWVGIGVGAAWWAVSFAVLNSMEPYTDGWSETSKMPAKTQREQLARERRAEESIRKAGALARRLKWISVVSNLGASAFMATSAQKNSIGLYAAAASGVVALTPLLFPHPWETNERLHHEYKKRIYAPVLGATVLSDPNGFIFSPGLQLSLRF